MQQPSGSEPGRPGALVGPGELEAPGRFRPLAVSPSRTWVEPIGMVLKHHEKDTPGFSWLLPNSREWAPAVSRNDTSLPTLGWHSPREQQKAFLRDRHWNWISVVRPGSLLSASLTLSSLAPKPTVQMKHM